MSTSYPSLTVLISGRGSNLVALHEKAVGYKIGAVISNRSDAMGIDWAKRQGLRTKVIERSSYSSLADHKEAILQAVLETEPDILALAGFMMILQPGFIEKFYGKLVNIHPSLLPKFPGLETHKRAIEAGEHVHGCSVHYVDSGVDTGPIIAQAKTTISSTENVETLVAKTLKLEHALYPWVIQYMIKNEISLQSNKVVYSKNVVSEAESMGIVLKG